MGRIRTLQIKRITRELMERHGDKFSNNFNYNQQVVNRFTLTRSKKLRNKIAGYVTRMIRKSNKEEE